MYMNICIYHIITLGHVIHICTYIYIYMCLYTCDICDDRFLDFPRTVSAAGFRQLGLEIRPSPLVLRICP